MSEEDELLNRTLQRCLREVRRALDADSDVKALATCKAGHCVSGCVCFRHWFGHFGHFGHVMNPKCLALTWLWLQSNMSRRPFLHIEVRGRVKSVYSVVKKLLRQRGVSREDLKAQALKARMKWRREVYANLELWATSSLSQFFSKILLLWANSSMCSFFPELLFLWATCSMSYFFFCFFFFFFFFFSQQPFCVTCFSLECV